jgi:hypothetical protein
MNLSDLGRIIDDLYALPLDRRSHIPRLIVIVGNGIRPVCNILNDDQLKLEATRRRCSANPSDRDFQELRWRFFEYARYFTAHSLPTLAHAAVFRLVKDRVCSDLITTNYDLYFDSLWAKYPGLGVRQNPVLREGEYDWDGYYSQAQGSELTPRYWKLHGSLSHVVFRGAGQSCHIHRLPRFPVSTNQPDLQGAFQQRMVPSLGYEASLFPRSRIPLSKTLQSQFDPFIDWTFGNKRELFTKEILAVRQRLQNPNCAAAILLIGFTAYYDPSNPTDPWNEEIVEDLLALQDKGTVPIFMAVHKKQFANLSKPSYHLMRRLYSISRCFPYDRAEIFARKLFGQISNVFPFSTVKAEHSIWRSYWFQSMKESVHV